jgi:hypothetical protein
MEQKEMELMAMLTELYGSAIVGSRSGEQVLHEIGAILIARKMFGNNGDSVHAQINRALDDYIKKYPVK